MVKEPQSQSTTSATLDEPYNLSPRKISANRSSSLHKVMSLLAKDQIEADDDIENRCMIAEQAVSRERERALNSWVRHHLRARVRRESLERIIAAERREMVDSWANQNLISCQIMALAQQAGMDNEEKSSSARLQPEHFAAVTNQDTSAEYFQLPMVAATHCLVGAGNNDGPKLADSSCSCEDFRSNRQQHNIDSPARLCQHLVWSYFDLINCGHDGSWYSPFRQMIRHLAENGSGTSTGLVWIKFSFSFGEYLIAMGGGDWVHIYGQGQAEAAHHYHPSKRQWFLGEKPEHDEQIQQVIHDLLKGIIPIS